MTNTSLLSFRNRTDHPQGSDSYKRSLPDEEQQLVNEYLDYRSITFGKCKLRDVQIAVLNFRHVTGKSLTAEHSLDDVKYFLKVLYQSNRSDESKKSFGEHLFTGRRAFLKWRYDDWHKKFSNFEDESGFRLVKWKTKPLADRLTENDLLTEDDIMKLWHACEKVRNQALILLHGVTPGRTKEIRELRWSDILFEKNRIRVHDTKTGKAREMPIDDLTSRAVKKWHDHYAIPSPEKWNQINPNNSPPKPHWHLFPSRDSPEKPISSHALWLVFKRAAKRAGIKKNVYGYLNRHSTITRYQAKGVDIRDVANVAGHASITTTLGYTHLKTSHSIQQVVAKVLDETQLPTEERDKYEDDINSLKSQLREVKELVRYMQQRASQ